MGVRPVDAGAPLATGDMSPAAQRLAHQEHVAHAFPQVLVVLACRPPRDDRHGRGDLGQQLAAGLIQAHLRAVEVIGPGIDLQHILHPPAELGVLLRWDAPALDQPWLEPVCFKACRTVSYDTDSITCSSTSRSAKSRNVQRLWPSGGALHASATNWASCSGGISPPHEHETKPRISQVTTDQLLARRAFRRPLFDLRPLMGHPAGD